MTQYLPLLGAMLFFIWGFSPPALFSQEYTVHIRKFSAESGLSHRYVTSICPDHNGYVWISTPYKLNRLDGQHIRHYSVQENHLQRNNHQAVWEDPKGKIWLMTFNWNSSLTQKGFGIFDILDPLTGQAQPLDSAFTLPFKSNQIQYIDQAPNKSLWVLLKTGAVYQCDGERFQFQFQTRDRALGITVSSQNRVAILTSTDILLYDTQGNRLWSLPRPPHTQRITKDISGRLFVETINPQNSVTPVRLWVIENDQPPTPFLLTDKQGRALFITELYGAWQSVYFDRENRAWAQSGADICLFDTSGHLLHRIEHLFDENHPNPVAYGFAFDLENNTWIATQDGAFFLSLSRPRFTRYLTSDHLVDTRGIYVDTTGNIYINQLGVRKVDAKTGKVEEISKGGSFSLYPDSKGNLWIGDYEARISRFHIKTGQMKTMVPFQKWHNEIFSTFCMYEDPDTGILWIGTIKRGLAYILPNEDSIRMYDNYGRFQKLRSADVLQIYPNEEGIWLVTNHGLYLWHPATGVKAHYAPPPLKNCIHLHEDADGIFWVGTAGNGLVRWNRANGEIENFTTLSGLSHDIITAVYEDDFGYLWLASFNGLMQFDKKSKTIQRIYWPDDGLPHQEFNFSSHYKAPNGHLFLGGLKGVVGFNPEVFAAQSSKNIPYQVQVIKLETLNTSTGALLNRTSDFFQNHEIVLNPKERAVILQFILPQVDTRNHITYAYQLEGYLNQWVSLTENTLRLNALPYGQYTLRIKGKNQKGQETLHDLQILLKVKTPYYLQPWFWALCGLFIIGGIYGIFKWRTQWLVAEKRKLEADVLKRTQIIEGQKAQLASQNEELKRLNTTKDRFFAIIAHDMRNAMYGFRGITDKITYFIERNQPERILSFGDQIDQSVKKLTGLMDNLLNWALLQRNAIPYNPETLNVREVIRHATRIFESPLEEKRLSLHIEAPQNLFVFSDKNALLSTIRNIVSNAIKFTPAGGTITCRAKVFEQSVLFEIEDTGIGISPQQIRTLFQPDVKKNSRGTAGETGSGLGLVLVKELIQLNKGHIEVESKEGLGTKFCFKLPVGIPEKCTHTVLSND